MESIERHLAGKPLRNRGGRSFGIDSGFGIQDALNQAMDSRLRGNDEGRRCGNDEGGRDALAGEVPAPRHAPEQHRDAHAISRRAATCRRPAASGDARRGPARATHSTRRAGVLARGVALALTLAGAATGPALAQVGVSVTSSPANGAYYTTGETITTRLTVPRLSGGNVQAVRMRLNIGGTTREAASTSSYSFRMTQVNFSYTVVGADVDPDGISIPASAIVGANRWATDGNRAINLNNAALPSQGAHKVFGGSGAVSAKTFYTGTAIAEFQAPAATGGNGALSYAASGLPAGLVFDADGTGTCPGTEPREFCGTPTTATSGAVTVTVTAQDADANRAAGDRDTLTFQVTVLDTPTLAASPTVASNPAPFPAPPVV